MGKTSLVLNFLHHMCRTQSAKALYFSIDISRISVLNKMVSLFGQLTVAQVMGYSKQIYESATEQKLHLQNAMNMIREYDLIIRDDLMKMDDIQRECGIRKPNLIIVDYIQAIECGDNGGREGIRDSMKRFKQIARDTGACIILLAQLLTKGSSTTKFIPPSNNEIKDCADIEHLADLVLLINRPRFYQERWPDMADVCPIKAGNDFVDLMLTKNRSGGLKNFEIQFRADYCIFQDKGSM